MAVTSYGRNKNHDDEIKKKTKRRPIIASAIAVRLLNKMTFSGILEFFPQFILQPLLKRMNLINDEKHLAKTIK